MVWPLCRCHALRTSPREPQRDLDRGGGREHMRASIERCIRRASANSSLKPQARTTELPAVSAQGRHSSGLPVFRILTEARSLPRSLYSYPRARCSAHRNLHACRTLRGCPEDARVHARSRYASERTMCRVLSMHDANNVWLTYLWSRDEKWILEVVCS